MRLFTAAALMWCLSGTSTAAEWRVAGAAYGEAGRSITFIDSESLKARRGKIHFRSREYFADDAGGFDAIALSGEADCARAQLTVTRSTYLLRGIPVAFGAPMQAIEVAPAGTATYSLIAQLCSGRFLSGPIPQLPEFARESFKKPWAALSPTLSINILPDAKVSANEPIIASVQLKPIRGFPD